MSVADAKCPKGVSREHLVEVWRSTIDEAQKILVGTTPLNHQDADASLSQKFGTNDTIFHY